MFVVQAKGDLDATYKVRHRLEGRAISHHAMWAARQLGWDGKTSLVWRDIDGLALGGFHPAR